MLQRLTPTGCSRISSQEGSGLHFGLTDHVRKLTERDKGKVNVKVYGLVSGAKRHSPDYTRLPTGRRICSFISRLNSLESIKPCCHHGAGNCLNIRKSSLSYQVPTYSWIEIVHAWVNALPRGTLPQQIQPTQRFEPVMSLLQVMHATTCYRVRSTVLIYTRRHGTTQRVIGRHVKNSRGHVQNSRLAHAELTVFWQGEI